MKPCIDEVFVALGGNLNEPQHTFLQALQQINSIKGICNLKISQFYDTTPVSAIPQPNYLNAVCQFHTSLSPCELLVQLQTIESMLGKKPKAKQEPRIIDLDILFFGRIHCRDDDLEIPHPRWKERLFVLMPLSDLTDAVYDPLQKKFINLKQLIRDFPNPHNETVRPMSHSGMNTYIPL